MPPFFASIEKHDKAFRIILGRPGYKMEDKTFILRKQKTFSLRAEIQRKLFVGLHLTSHPSRVRPENIIDGLFCRVLIA